MNYYRRYVGDYLRDTSRLSMLEHGAYTLLLDYYYAEEQALPLERDDVYRMVRAMSAADRAAVDKIITLYFSEQPDGFHNGRADRELEVATKLIDTARENGKLGGRPRKTKNETDLVTPQETRQVTGTETQLVTREQSQAEPVENHPPSTIHHTPTTTTPSASTALRAPASPSDPDPIFGVCLDFLKAKQVPERNARSFLGMLRKQRGDDAVFAAVEAARREDVTDPIPWLTKALQARGANGKARSHARLAGQDYSAGVDSEGRF